MMLKITLISLGFIIEAMIEMSSADQAEIGTTFSRKQCEYLDIDWRDTYRAVLDLPWDMIRLSAYWDEIEESEGVYDYSVLDEQISKAEKQGIPVTLTVGMKAPRWPEFHIPGWLLEKTNPGFAACLSENPVIRAKTLAFIRRTVLRYRQNPIVRYWQVENEALNRFGKKYWIIGREFLAKEVSLVRELDDQKRPVILTASTYPQPFLRWIARLFTTGEPIADNLSLCDALGVNVYPIIGQKIFGYYFYWFSNPAGAKMYFHKLRRQAVRHDKSIWVTELQAEPWEPGHLVYKGQHKLPTVWPENTLLIYRQLKNLGYKKYLIWGCEYGYYLKIRRQNDEWYGMIRDLLDDRKDFHR